MKLSKIIASTRATKRGGGSTGTSERYTARYTLPDGYQLNAVNFGSGVACKSEVVSALKRQIVDNWDAHAQNEALEVDC